MTTEVASLKAVFTADTSNLIKGANQAKGAIVDAGNVMSNKLKTLGGNITNLGKNWTVATAPITAALGISVKKFASFEAAMANAHSITGATGDAAKQLNDQILNIGGSVRQGPQAVAEAYYQIVSGVGDASQHMSILNTGLAVSEAGAADLSATIGGLIGSMNSYGASAEDAAKFGDIMTATVQSGVLTMDELAAALPNVTGTSSQLGVEFENVAAALARMTQMGIPAAQASTQIRQAMTEVQKPSKELQAIFDQMQVTDFKELLADTGSFTDAMRAIQIAADDANVDLISLFGSTEAYNAAVILGTQETMNFTKAFEGIATGAADAEAALNNMSAGTKALSLGGDTVDMMGGFDGSTDIAQAIQADTLTSDVELMNASLSELAVTVGETLAPFIGDLAEKITEVVDSVTEWATANPEAATTLTMIAGAAVIAGPALITLGMAVTALGTGVGVLTGAFALLTSPVVAVVAAGIGLGIIFAELINKAGGLGNLIKNTLNTAFMLLGIAILGPLATLKEIFTAIGNILGEIPGIGPAFQVAFRGLAALVDGVAQAIMGVAGFIGDVIIALGTLLGMQGGGSASGSNISVGGGGVGSNVGGVSLGGTTSFGGGGGQAGAIDAGGRSGTELAPDAFQQKAAGGPVMGGSTYLVGEEGPEMFVPGRSGTIIPNHALAGAGGGGRTIVLQNPVFNGVTDIQTFFDELEREAGRRS